MKLLAILVAAVVIVGGAKIIRSIFHDENNS